MMSKRSGGRRRLALVRTYGKYRERTVKSAKWLSPGAGREHLFSSSSDSINSSSRSQSTDSSNPSFNNKKRQRKVLLNVSNAKSNAKQKAGKQTNGKTCTRKKPYPLRNQNHSTISTEGESQEDCILVEDKENYFAPVTRSKAEQIPKPSPQLKYVTYRRKRRSCKIVSNQILNTQFQMRRKELLGSLLESSGSSTSFAIPNKTDRSVCKAENFNRNLSVLKKLGRSPLQTSTPSCTRKLRIKEPSRSIISFNLENEENSVCKNSVEPSVEGSIDHPSTEGICCSQSSNTSCKPLASTDLSNHSEFARWSPKKLDRICSFEADCEPVALMSLAENLERADAVTLFQTPKDDLYQTLDSTFNNSKELFSDVIEVSARSPETGLINGVDDTKAFGRNSLEKSGLFNCAANLDMVTKQENYESRNTVSKLDLQPIIHLDYFSVPRYFHKMRSMTSVEDDSFKVSSSQGAAGKKQQLINHFLEKLTPQKSVRKSFNQIALQPDVVLSPLALQWHLPVKKDFRNLVNRSLADGAFDEYKCNFHLPKKECKHSDYRNLQSSRSTMYFSSQGGKSGKGLTADFNLFEPIINRKNRKAISVTNGNSSGVAFQKNIDPVSNSAENAGMSTVHLCEHPYLQRTGIKTLQSTFMNSSSVSTPLGSRNWSRFKAAHSIHKRNKVVITPFKSDCSMPDEDTLETSYLLRKESCNDQSLKKLASMANLSPTPTSSRIRSLRGSFAKKLSSILQPVFLTDEEKVYNECGQNGPISFKECIPLAKLKKCVKIGEGVFGEVFQTTNDDGQYVVFKIIPIEGEKPVNDEPQKKFEEILPEIIISKELSELSEERENCTIGFISLHSVHCVKDSYPLDLLKAWDKYHQIKTSENDRPDEVHNEQLYIIFEFEYGGCDLESMNTKIPSLEAARSILQQVTASLAVAENALNFEHRDLHWGNVLIKKTDFKQVEYKLCGNIYSIDSHGFMVNIIDYTLSRMGKGDVVQFCDLSSEDSFFHGQGDYQFDIYREMKKENLNNWATYNPHTNVLWLHYLADKMLSLQYKKRTTRAHKTLEKQFKEFMHESLEHQCAVDLLASSPLFQNS
ncbi:uncharacterized protein haspin [Scyliorhinus torazame]|uniref:uncharacterized protein haspin n=1 Tax=Scyliorhinus torazame TaxID=75743 RepID=UPI003B597BF3